nr:serine protease [Bacteroidales bacterium]
RNNFIITDEYIHKIKKSSTVEIKFMKEDGHTNAASLKIKTKELKQRIISDADSGTAYALIHINFPEFASIPSLKLCTNDVIEVGQAIASIGFQINQENLAIKTGIVSSLFKHNNSNNYIQFDSSIKQGNSGSPLINTETGEVIGVVGHRLAAITKSYKRMNKIIENNLTILKNSQGKFDIHEIDPIQVLIANQNQIKYITNEIYKTANMRVGFALKIQHIVNLFDEFQDVSDSRYVKET